MRLVMMGTGPFAVPTFQALLDSRHEVVALVTRPTPPPVGRRKTPANPMREVGVARGLSIFEPESINDESSIARLREFAADLFVVCDYGQILSPDCLRVAPLGGINLHASLLPKYRGSAPINWAMYRGEKETGVSVIHMSPALDAGNVLAVKSTPIDPRETAVELEARLAELGIEPVLESIDLLESWDRASLLGTPQDPAQVTKARRLRKTDAAVNWTRTAAQIARQVRAFQPWPGTFVLWARGQGEPLRLVLNQVAALPSSETTAEPGTVVQSDGHSLQIATGRGLLAIEKIQPAGKRSLEIAEFLRGYPLAVGTRLG